MTDSSSRIRKQVYELSPQDFVDHPVWEFCADEEGVEGQDEATVRPTTKIALSDELPGACVVAAKVILADGTYASGYLYNCGESDIGCVQPNLFAGQSQINLWLGWLRFLPSAPERIPEHYGTIGKCKEEVFPVSFQSTVNVNGKPLQVVLQGFMALDKDNRLVVFN